MKRDQKQKTEPSRDRKRHLFVRTAGFLYERLYGHLPGSTKVSGNIRLLSMPGTYNTRIREYYVRKLTTILLILTAGIVLSVLYKVSEGNESETLSTIERAAYGGADRSISVTARNSEDGKEEGSYAVEVRARRYTHEEAADMAGKLEKSLPGRILGDNADLQNVTENLELVTRVEGYPFQISWDSSRYLLVSSNGDVDTQALEGASSGEVILTAVLSYEEYRFRDSISVIVVPKVLSEKEERASRIREAIEKSEEESISDAFMKLPESVSGIALTWKKKKENTVPLICLLTFAGAVLFYKASDAEIGRKVRERDRELERDYSILVGKLVLFLGAGMSVRNIFFKLAEEGGKERYIFHEIQLVCYELESGISEKEAYERFGRRCRLPAYRRLATLLTQNLRKGNTALLKALREEAAQSLNERRNLARERGEEAGTRMIFPMVIMLAVTMMIIIIPAYRSFSG